MTEIIYGVAVVCLLVASFKLGKRRAFKNLKIDNRTPLRIDIDVHPDDARIVIKSISPGE